MKYLIYAYVKKENNQVVYVGLTNNLQRRRLEHERYEPFEEGRPHYNYPLSRGIRKYGPDYYECIVLEDNLTEEEAKEQEKYWIKYYDTYNDPEGYNYTPGGGLTHLTKFSESIIKEVKSLLKQKYLFKDIMELTGVSIPHISEINTGKRWFDKNETYPLNDQTCGRKLTKEQVLEVIEKIKKNYTFQQIGIEFNVSETTIKKINDGKTYHLDNINYPIREKRLNISKNHKLTEEELLNLIEDLQNTNIPFSQLASKYQVGTTTIYNINKGTTRKKETLQYPLRK